MRYGILKRFIFFNQMTNFDCDFDNWLISFDPNAIKNSYRIFRWIISIIQLLMEQKKFCKMWAQIVQGVKNEVHWFSSRAIDFFFLVKLILNMKLKHQARIRKSWTKLPVTWEILKHNIYPTAYFFNRLYHRTIALGTLLKK